MMIIHNMIMIDICWWDISIALVLRNIIIAIAIVIIVIIDNIMIFVIIKIVIVSWIGVSLRVSNTNRVLEYVICIICKRIVLRCTFKWIAFYYLTWYI